MQQPLLDTLRLWGLDGTWVLLLAFCDWSSLQEQKSQNRIGVRDMLLFRSKLQGTLANHKDMYRQNVQQQIHDYQELLINREGLIGDEVAKKVQEKFPKETFSDAVLLEGLEEPTPRRPARRRRRRQTARRHT